MCLWDYSPHLFPVSLCKLWLNSQLSYLATVICYLRINVRIEKSGDALIWKQISFCSGRHYNTITLLTTVLLDWKSHSCLEGMYRADSRQNSSTGMELTSETETVIKGQIIRAVHKNVNIIIRKDIAMRKEKETQRTSKILTVVVVRHVLVLAVRKLLFDVVCTGCNRYWQTLRGPFSIEIYSLEGNCHSRNSKYMTLPRMPEWKWSISSLGSRKRMFVYLWAHLV